jgi:hypothetical protein
MWNFTCLIGVFTIVNLINNIKPMPNYIITCPLIVLLSVMLLVHCKAWNCLYPAIEYFKALILITTL